MAGVDLKLTLVELMNSKVVDVDELEGGVDELEGGVDELEGGELVELLIKIVEAYFISFIRCFLI